MKFDPRIVLETAFQGELRKEAFYAGLENELEKLGFLPALALGAGVGALMGAGSLGLAALTKPKDMTWRGAGFTPGKILGHLADWGTVGAKPAWAAVNAGLSAIPGSASPLAYRPPSISGSPVSALAKKIPGAF